MQLELLACVSLFLAAAADDADDVARTAKIITTPSKSPRPLFALSEFPL